jgi:ferrochelatase
LERELRRQLDARVFVAMRYWHPLTAEVAAQVADWEPDELVLLPLYPQYSRVTSGSSLKEWHRQWLVYSAGARVRVLRGFYRHPLYVEAVVEKIEQTLARFPRGAPVTLLFSAHSVPASVIAAGDPYRDQTETTVERVCERGAWHLPVRLCYQSKAGPGRWIEPMLHATLRELAGGGSSHVLIVPISFVSEHIETLYEIDIEAREFAGELGFTQFEMMPALNDSPLFIAALAGLVQESLETEEETRSAALDTRGEATINSSSRQN